MGRGDWGRRHLHLIVTLYIKQHAKGRNALDISWKQQEHYESEMEIAISDVNEIWWLESTGDITDGTPRTDDAYVVNPNQLGSDFFDFEDKENFMWPDLKDFMIRHHLNLNFDGESFNPRYAFGSQTR